jgi:hypothetical protein
VAQLSVELNVRLKRDWVVMVFLGVLAWFDWLMHREFFVLLLLAAGVAAIVLYRKEIAERLGIVELLASMPPWGRALLRTSPALIYFMARGSGTSGAGGVVVVTTLALVSLITFFGRVIDARLARYYDRRDRLLPKAGRMLIALGLSIVTAFTVIHGAISDLPALIGGATGSPQSPMNLTGRFILALILVATTTTLLVRERPQ